MLAHDLLSSLDYPMITYIPLVASNFVISTVTEDVRGLGDIILCHYVIIDSYSQTILFLNFFTVCKHYITHGCKLGNSCKFLHCTPEELANKMATNDPPARNGPKSLNSHDSPRPKHEYDYPSPSRQRQDSTEKMDTSDNSSPRK